MMEMPVPARLTPVPSSRLVIILMQRTALVCPPLSSWLGWHADKSPLSFPGLSLACGSLLLCLPTRCSPAVSPLAEGARLDRIPIAPTVCGPRLRSTGFKRPAGQGEECTSCFIRRAD